MSEEADLFDIGGEAIPTDESKLAQLRKYLEEYTDLFDHKANLEEDIKAANSRIHKIGTIIIPELLSELQMDMIPIKLPKEGKTDPRTFDIVDVVAGSLPKDEEKRSRALHLLKEYGGENLLKTSVELKFGKSEAEQAAEVVELLKEFGIEPSVAETVHPQTLASFVRERLRNGEKVDAEALGVYVGKTIKIKEPSQ